MATRIVRLFVEIAVDPDHFDTPSIDQNVRLNVKRAINALSFVVESEVVYLPQMIEASPLVRG